MHIQYLIYLKRNQKLSSRIVKMDKLLWNISKEFYVGWDINLDNMR